MIRVTVELVPHGDEALKKKIGSLVLANVGNNNLPKGVCWYQSVYEDDIFGKHYAEVTHERAEGVWVLLRKLLASPIPTYTKDEMFKRLEGRL